MAGKLEPVREGSREGSQRAGAQAGAPATPKGRRAVEVEALGRGAWTSETAATRPGVLGGVPARVAAELAAQPGVHPGRVGEGPAVVVAAVGAGGAVGAGAAVMEGVHVRAAGAQQEQKAEGQKEGGAIPEVCFQRCFDDRSTAPSSWLHRSADACPPLKSSSWSLRMPDPLPLFSPAPATPAPRWRCGPRTRCSPWALLTWRR